MGPLTTSSLFWPQCTCFELILKLSQPFYMLNKVEKLIQKATGIGVLFHVAANAK